MAPEDPHHHQQHQFPRQQCRGQPERQDLAPGETDQGGEDVEPVGRRVEEPAEAADLVPAPGELAVQIVADTAQREHEQRPAVALGASELRPQDQPQEQRHADQASHAEDVRDGEDPVRLDTGLLDLHPGASCGKCANDAP